MSPYDVSIRTHPKWICCHCFDNEMHFPITSMSIKWSCTRFLIANSADVWSLSQHMLPFPNFWRAPGLEVREKLVFFALASFKHMIKKRRFFMIGMYSAYTIPLDHSQVIKTTCGHFEESFRNLAMNLCRELKTRGLQRLMVTRGIPKCQRWS